jgi:hypothetical protein
MYLYWLIMLDPSRHVAKSPWPQYFCPIFIFEMYWFNLQCLIKTCILPGQVNKALKSVNRQICLHRVVLKASLWTVLRSLSIYQTILSFLGPEHDIDLFAVDLKCISQVKNITHLYSLKMELLWEWEKENTLLHKYKEWLIECQLQFLLRYVYYEALATVVNYITRLCTTIVYKIGLKMQNLPLREKYLFWEGGLYCFFIAVSNPWSSFQF